jgi:quinol monooxygenase YgiN
LIHVLAFITAKPGLRDQVLAEFRANMPAVRAEEGCIEYGPAVDTEGLGGIQTKLGPDAFVVVEKWASVEALKAHAAAAHMHAYAARTRDMVVSRVIHILSPV